MLANNWHGEEMARLRRIEFMRQAEQARFVKQMAPMKTSPVAQFRRQLGRWLIAAGQRLQSPQPQLRNVHEW